MRTLPAILLAVLLACFALAHKAHAAVNLQTCTVTPTSGGLIGCPTPAVMFAPVAPTSLVRSQVNGVQGWRPYAALSPVDRVVAQSDGAWHILGDLTVATSTVTPPSGSPPTQTPPTTPPVTTWVAMNWTCSVANNIATCTAPIKP